MVLALVEAATRSTIAKAGVTIFDSDVGIKITFQGSNSRRARKSGAISFAQRARGSGEHLSRYSKNRSRKPTSDHYFVARPDRPFRKRLCGQRHANEGTAFANEIGIRSRVLQRDRCGA